MRTQPTLHAIGNRPRVLEVACLRDHRQQGFAIGHRLHMTYGGGMSLRIIIGLTLASIAGAALPMVPASAAPAASAVPKWSMVPMSKDSGGDGFIDGDGGVPASGALTMQPSTTFVGAGNGVAQPDERLIGGSLSWYLDAAGYPVRLDACDSSGDTYSWTIIRPDGTSTTTPERSLKKKTCGTTMLLPEGANTFTLRVKSGTKTVTKSVTAAVSNILMVALGDSYASGEGNPRNVESWLAGGSLFAPFTPYWDSDPCNRSTRGAPAQAALALEQSSPKTSVTLVYVACSGATVTSGVLGPFTAAGQTQSQIEQVRQIIGGRKIDLVSLSIGGNDIGFTSVLTACSSDANCPIGTPPRGTLSGYPTVQAGVQARTAQLPAAYARIAGCLGGATCSTTGPGASTAPLQMAPGARVLATLYPDITRAADGGPCDYLTIRSANMAWARDTTLVPNPAPSYDYLTTSRSPVTFPLTSGTLNQQIAATSSLGWTPVIGSWSASGESAQGHGVCAGDQAWAFGLTALNGMSSASFHPNPAGQVVIATAMAGALTPAVSLSTARR